MNKTVLFFFGLLSAWVNLFSQGLYNMYLSGYTGPYRNTIDFVTSIPNVITDSIRKSNLSYTHANISDKNGNLLFYTNGIVVLDGNHDTMPNGKGLNPCQATTNNAFYGLPSFLADIIIPVPNDSNKYFLIHQSLEYLSIYASSKIYFSVVDMTLNNGNGDVIQKNTSFYQDTLAGGMNTACKHANGRDWWLIIPKFGVPTYHIFLVTPQGIQFSSTQTIGQRWDIGQAAFSPDGKHYGFYGSHDGMDIMDFDRCTGILSNCRHETVNDSIWGLGFCFSPDSKLAYAACALYLYQFNLDSTNLGSSMQTVATWDSTYNPNPPIAATFEFMQIAPDQKIYMTTVWATKTMHFINYPDSLGTPCDMHQHSIALATYNHCTMPNFPNYFLGPVIGSICDSLGLGVPEQALHDFKFTIQPNPLTDKVLHCKYLLPQNKPGLMEISDITGRSILKEPLPQWSTEQHIKLTVSPGIYLVKLKSNQQQVVKKIVVP